MGTHPVGVCTGIQNHAIRLEDPRPEDWCRDALLSVLQKRLMQLDIDAQAEAHYADGKRSDIRVSFGGVNVPVEIKRSCSSRSLECDRDTVDCKIHPGSGRERSWNLSCILVRTHGTLPADTGRGDTAEKRCRSRRAPARYAFSRRTAQNLDLRHRCLGA